MSETLLALLAFSPIVVAAILLVGLNWPAKKSDARGICVNRCYRPIRMGYV